MSDPGKAVFLSYASQDAEAAKRICDALRAAGVEVWFDQSELVGGDAWDQKIRKQIRDCALLIPIVSANTQARTEGYFRLEWRLADQRTHLMAKGRPFLLPVVVDGTRDVDAQVPDSFTEIQWTKAPDGVVPAAFALRVKNLLGGDGGRDRPISPAAYATEKGGPVPQSNRRRWLLGVIGGVAAVALAGYFGLRPGEKSAVPTTATPAATPKLSPAREMAERAWELAKRSKTDPEGIRASVAMGERAIELDPMDDEVWATASLIDLNSWVQGTDRTDQRLESALTKARRAKVLKPRGLRARLAEAKLFASVPKFSSHAREAETTLRTLLQENPPESEVTDIKGSLGMALQAQGRMEEAAAMMAEAGAAAPGWMDAAAWAYLMAGRLDEALAAARRESAMEPINGWIQEWRVHVARGDLAAAEKMAIQLSSSLPVAGDESGNVFFQWLRGDPEAVLAQVKQASGDYVLTLWSSSPKRMFAGWAHHLAGREEAARSEWLAALQVVERRITQDGSSYDGLDQRCQLLALLDRKEEAAQAYRLLHQLHPEEAKAFDSERLVLLGRLDNAYTTLARELRDARRPWSAHGYVRLAPSYAPLRSDPRVTQLLRETLPSGAKPIDDQLPAVSDQRSAPSPRPRTLEPGPSSPVAPDAKSVAVLAFANLSDDKANEYFSDGISEELLNVLAKVPGLKVTARTSSFHFKGRDTPVPEIARQLGVAYVVEGSVRKSGDKVRITAQLIKAADGFHVWSDTFTRDLKDVFAVQDEIAGLVAKNLEAKLGAAPRTEARVDGRALELYMQGRAAWNRRNAEGFDRAEALFRQALAIAPDFARAHAALADVWMIRAISDDKLSRYGQRASPVIKPIEAEAMRALELDPESAEAHATLGYLRQLQHRPEEALRLLRRSVELNPNYPTGHHWLAGILAYQSWFDECIAEYRRAVAVDPLSPRILDNFGWTLVTLGRLQEGLEFIDGALALQPNEPQALAHRVFTLARLGRREEARALGAKVADRYRLAVLAETGDRAALETALLAAQGPDRGLLLTALGRQDEALDDFQADDIILEDNQDWFFDPRLVPWHQDPRFRKVVVELGFEDNLARALAWVAAHPPEKPKAGP